MKKLLFAIVFLAGAACGYVGYGLCNGKPAEKPADDGTAAVSKKKNSSRLEELERELAKARGEIARLKKANEDAEKAVASALDNKPKPEQTFEFPTNIDLNAELKKNLDEEQFTAATNAIAGFRARLAARAKGRIDFLSAVDTSKMSASDRENHEKYLDIMKRREELMGKNKGGLPDMDTIQQMMEIQMQMGPAAKKERAVLVGEVARELGYQGDEAEVVQDTISSIYDCTSGGGLMGGIEEAIETMGPAMGGPGMGGPGGPFGGPAPAQP